MITTTARPVLLAVALLTATTVAAAQPAREAPQHRADVSAVVAREAWDLNQSREHLVGAVAGAERRVWRGLAVRGELLVKRVSQHDGPTWLGGAALAARLSGRRRGAAPYAEIGGGWTTAGRPVPPSGTAANYVLLAGGGLDLPAGDATLTLGLRWLHLSNNGRAGRHRNPDVQAIAASAGIAWRF